MTSHVAETLEPAPSAAASRAAASSWRAPLLLAAATALLLLPFAGKPLHVDDPMYLWAAQHIAGDPLDPYGFEVNWYGTDQPMAVVMKNPPLVCYYLAATSQLLGWSEWALHLALLLPAIGVVLGVHRLAREVGAEPTLAALTMLLTPVFLLSASTVMSDVSMLCGYVWAIAFWVRGLREERALPLVVASLLIAVSTLTKYFGITLFPLLIATALVQAPRQWRRWLPPLALPIALLTAYQLWTRDLYGQGHLLEVGSYATATRGVIGSPLWQRLTTAVSFIGGGSLTAALVLLAGARRREIAWWARLFAGVLLVLFALNPYPLRPIRGPEGFAPLFWLQLGGFVTAGLGILVYAVREAQRRWLDPQTALLVFWLLGTLVFAGGLNWSVNGRATLAAAPAAALLAARHADRLQGWRRRAAGGALLAGGVLALLVTLADSSHARSARRAAAEIHERFPDRRIWFIGHWGFQQYMEQLGARPVDGAHGSMQRGDLVVQPRNNSYSFHMEGAEGALPMIHVVAVPTLRFLATMELEVRAGFYTDMLGPLPYGFGRVPPDVYMVMEVRGPVRPVANQ